jgi:hypothetical protein|tara:strand:+ start:2212 stop:2934 length:723 start_codon:yes stop_codon:yes gene_type:complete
MTQNPDTRTHLEEYLKESTERNMSERKEYSLYNRMPVYVKDALPQKVSLVSVIQKIEDFIPVHLLSHLEMIIVAHLPEFDERDITAVFKDGAIYVSNQQEDEQELFEDMVHEIAHAVEHAYPQDIYADGKIEGEFLVKRRTLYQTLKTNNYLNDKVIAKHFFDVEYSQKLDMFFYRDVGYDALSMLTVGLFVSPYGATSLREYFANGFEEYFTGEPHNLKKISPQLYIKFQNLVEKGEMY